MKDPWNPTEEEIRDWAFDVNKLCPVQDWDLAVADLKYKKALLSLASDPACPKREFFLAVLYLIVGDAVRSRWQAHRQSEINKLLAEACRYSDVSVLRWVERSQHLIGNPGEFDYNLWCSGGYVYVNLDNATSSEG